MKQRFPAVERIDPIPLRGTLKVDYVVVAELGQYFNAKHKKAVEQALHGKISNLCAVTVKSGVYDGKARLAVAVDPHDSMGGPSGSFVVHDTLQEIFQPAVPFVAVAVLRSSMYAPGDIKLGIQVLGNPSTETLTQLEREILAVPRTKSVQRDPKDPQHLIAMLAGPVSALDEYRIALIEHAGIASMIVADSRRLRYVSSLT
jgi:hypothetical protein